MPKNVEIFFQIQYMYTLDKSVIKLIWKIIFVVPVMDTRGVNVVYRFLSEWRVTHPSTCQTNNFEVS